MNSLFEVQLYKTIVYTSSDLELTAILKGFLGLLTSVTLGLLLVNHIETLEGMNQSLVQKIKLGKKGSPLGFDLTVDEGTSEGSEHLLGFTIWNGLMG